MLALPFVDEFDVVVSFNVLHWLVDQRAALTSIARATKPGGRVIVQQVCAGPRAEPGAARDAGLRAAPLERRVRRFRRAIHPCRTRRATRRSPPRPALLVTSQQVQDVEWDFGSRAAFTRWCTVGFADWTARLRPDSVGRWVDDVVTDYQELIGRPGLFRFMQLRAEMTPA